MAAESAAQAVMCTRSPHHDYNDKDSRKKNHHWDHFQSGLMSDSQSKCSLSIIGTFSLKNVAGVFLILVYAPDQSQSSLVP